MGDGGADADRQGPGHLLAFYLSDAEHLMAATVLSEREVIPSAEALTTEAGRTNSDRSPTAIITEPVIGFGSWSIKVTSVDHMLGERLGLVTVPLVGAQERAAFAVLR